MQLSTFRVLALTFATWHRTQEYAARNAANIQWMQDTFAEAISNGSAAVMFITQADPRFDLTDGKRAPLRDPKTLAETDTNPDAYQDFCSPSGPK